jgi:hypothetical protein
VAAALPPRRTCETNCLGDPLIFPIEKFILSLRRVRSSSTKDRELRVFPCGADDRALQARHNVIIECVGETATKSRTTKIQRDIIDDSTTAAA